MDLEPLNAFLDRHHINVLDKNKRYCRYKSNYTMFDQDMNKDIMKESVKFESEPLYTVEIPESQLIRLQKFEDEVFNNRKYGAGHYNYVEAILDQKYEEERLREQYPVVKQAYEEYSMVLNLCKDY